MGAADAVRAQDSSFSNSEFQTIESFLRFWARIEDALAFLDQFALASMPEDAHRLMLILLSFAEITSTIEAWGEQNPEHIGPWERFPPLPETEAI